MGRRGNVILGVGLSTALHAALLTGLEAPHVSRTESTHPALTVRLSTPAEVRSSQRRAPPHKSAPKPAAKERSADRKLLPMRYLPATDVDVPARPLAAAPLIYPENPFIWKLAGVVRLRVLISERGTVDAAEVLSAQPEGEFEEAALAAVSRLVYEPARRGGRPVRSEKLIEVTFDPYATASRR